MMRQLAVIAVLAGLLLVSSRTYAVDPTEMPTPELQQRYLGLTHELRCMQCQNEAIADSPVSLAADLRFDDPTVSRRHALIVRQPDGVRLLDDRSLNGVFVNGARVEGKVLRDGDEIIVGRYRLGFLSVRESPDGDPEKTEKSSLRATN